MLTVEKNYLCTFFLLGTLFFAFNVSGYSQNQEIGLRIATLENLDFIYKKEKQENRFIRYRILFAGVGVSLQDDNESVSAQFGLGIGIENRRAINDRFYFIHGIEPSLAVSVASNSSLNNWNLQPSFGYVLGFLYNFSDEFSVNIETIPALSVGMNLRNDTRNSYTLNAGFNSNAVALTLAYRFKNKPKK